MKKSIRYLLACTGLLFAGNTVFGQLNYTFTPAGATGNVGPTQGMVDAAYVGTSLDGNVDVVGGIQYWVVPTSGDYQIEAWGGQGYGAFGGRGAYISGDIFLSGGDTLKILVGQMGGHYLNYPSTTYNHQFGGGGGSFITTTTNVPMIVAGGGGGNHGTAYVASCDGQAVQNGAAGANASTIGAGGTAGNGGAQATSADGGGGFFGNGGGTAGGQSFVNGGLGGIDEGTGGFGCGGGTSSWNNYRGGGGGGYSGGGGGNNGGTCCPAGGGGGSFVTGQNQIAMSGIQIGDGLVVITPLTKIPNDAGIEEVQGFVPPVCKGDYPLMAKVRNYGNNIINPITVNWTIDGVAQTPVTYSSPIDTIGGPGPDSAWISLGTISVVQATSIEIWTSMPNNVPDTSNFNDTLWLNIAAPAVVAASVTTPISCFGDTDATISASGTGGTPGYTYLWSTGETTDFIDSLAPGVYSILVEDVTGCQDSMLVTVIEPQALNALDFITDISCYGQIDGECVISPQYGTPGYTVIWSTGDTSSYIGGLAAGTYDYTVIDDHGCVYTNSVSIAEPTELVVTIAVFDESTPGAGNGYIQSNVTGGTPPYAYAWSNGDMNQGINGLSAGTYTLTVTDGNGCTTSSTGAVGSTGMNEVTSDFNFTIYPNPSKGKFTVDFSELNEAVRIEVVDLLGKRVELIENIKASQAIQLNENSGVYIVKVIHNKNVYTKRLVIQK